MSLRSLPGELRTAGRFLWGLDAFLRGGAPQDSEGHLRASLARRAAAFVSTVETAVHALPASPYRELLRHAGVELADVKALVARDGVEGALAALHAAGVWLSLDEFKGRTPIVRGSLTIRPAPRVFDNPHLGTYFEGTTGGSRSRGSRVANDLGLLAHEACYDQVVVRTLPFDDRPIGVWRPVPPGSAGLKICLRLARIGRPVDQWFSQTPVVRSSDWRHTALLQAALAVARRTPGRIPTPVHVPPGGASHVARWLAARVAEGRPALLDTNAASAVRACLAAQDLGLDISGTFFRTGGEPLSAGKLDVLSASGCRAACHYSLSEAGRLGHACGHPAAPDEVHVASDKIALLERPATAPGVDVAGLFATTLLPVTAKVLINVELGDYATRSTRACGCLWETLGFTDHLHTIRSYEKLTSEGMHFVGAELLELVERVLPARFGGSATDYQLVEEEARGLPRVSVVVSPRVQVTDPDRIVEAVLDSLASGGAANRMMAAVWRSGGTLRVVRREPHVTRVGKIHALHVPQSEAATS